MKKRGDVGAALAVMAAVAGAGYASGRELVFFFAQTGWAAWAGIPFASLVFGLLTGMVCRCARASGASSFAGLCGRLLGPRAGTAAAVLHALLLALTAAAMLCAAGEIGALTLPLRHGFLWGASLALLFALLANLAGLRPLRGAGFAVLAAGVLFYVALAVDPRPPRIYLRGEVGLALRGSLPAALLLALAYGAMNACLAAGVAVYLGRSSGNPARMGAQCGGMLCILLACANAAIARGGDALLAQAMPTVLLAARWGTAGFWASALFSFLCAATTLSAAIGGLADQLRMGRQGRAVLAAPLLAAAALFACHAAGFGYAAVGWVCAFAMGIAANALFRLGRGAGR